MTTDARELATSLAKIYQKSIDEPWRGAPNELTQVGPAEGFKDCWDTINNSYRSTAQAVMLEQALEPLRKAVTSLTPAFDELKTNRASALLDFDANRRRLSALEKDKVIANANQKHYGDSAIALDAKIEKYIQKKTTTGMAYDELNTDAKQHAIDGKRQHDELMDSIIITAAVCQAELFRLAAAELDRVIDTMPVDRVNDIRMRMHELLKAGGTILPDTNKDRRPSILQRASGAFGGMFQPKEQPLTPVSRLPGAGGAAADDNTEEDTRGGGGRSTVLSVPAPPRGPTSAPPQLPQATPVQAQTSKPFAAATPAAAPASAPAAPSPAPPARKYPVVTALYDNEIDADDELPFSKGDKVEVLKTEEGGWWFGRCNGREGLFPVDYVNIAEMPK
jgi:hypothetical protein